MAPHTKEKQLLQHPVLIFGANGMVGRALTSEWGNLAVALSHTDCDITQRESIETILLKYKPAAIFNCAAITNVDTCEKEPELAMRVNAAAVEMMATVCKQQGITLIHFSTDYVFDGSGNQPSPEDRKHDPINQYGASKAAGEAAIESIRPDYIIARVQWVFGQGRQNFVDDVATKLRNDVAVRAFSDQFGSPTYAHDAAAMVTELYREGHRGIFHAVSTGYTNRVEIAQEVARQLRISSPEIIPVTTASVSLPAQRPLNSRLSIDKISKLGIHPPTWQDAVGRYLKAVSLRGTQ